MLNGISRLRRLLTSASSSLHAGPRPHEMAPVKRKGQEAHRLSQLITKAVAVSRERSGLSLAVLKKALVAATSQDMDKNDSQMKLGFEPGEQGPLVQTKGTGASGSFNLNKKA